MSGHFPDSPYYILIINYILIIYAYPDLYTHILYIIYIHMNIITIVCIVNCPMKQVGQYSP